MESDDDWVAIGDSLYKLTSKGYYCNDPWCGGFTSASKCPYSPGKLHKKVWVQK